MKKRIEIYIELGPNLRDTLKQSSSVTEQKFWDKLPKIIKSSLACKKGKNGRP